MRFKKQIFGNKIEITGSGAQLNSSSPGLLGKFHQNRRQLVLKELLLF
jgi:hypothetical protein